MKDARCSHVQTDTGDECVNKGKAAAFLTSLALLIVMMVGSINMTAFADEEPNIEVNAPPHIVFMGDSIATGFGLEGYSAEDKSKCASYANLLTAVFDSELPEAAGFSSDNIAKDGLTSKKMLANLREGLYDKELKHADAIVISIGGNDLLKPLLNIASGENSFSEVVDKLFSLGETLDKNLDDYSENLENIMAEIYARNSSSDLSLFVQTLYDPLEGNSLTALADMAKEKIDRLNEIIKAEADPLGYEVVDIAKAFEGENVQLTNIEDMDIHPNAAGHSRIAKTLQPIIESHIYTYYDPEAAAADEKVKDNDGDNGFPVGAAAAVTASAAAVGVFAAVITARRKTR